MKHQTEIRLDIFEVVIDLSCPCPTSYFCLLSIKKRNLLLVLGHLKIASPHV